MDRRTFLQLAGAGAAALALPVTAAAEGQCGEPQCNPMNGYCQRVCTVGLPSGFVSRVAARQQSSQWCWAACIEMVFAAHGFKVSQKQFVLQTFGSMVDMPGNAPQILAALNRVYVDANGKPFRAHGDALSVNIQSMSHDLFQRQPLIIGTMGHATVLTAMSWVEDNVGRWQITEAVVRDPWPTSPSRRVLSPQEWFNIQFAARVRCEPLQP